jgi:hypothetical protein
MKESLAQQENIILLLDGNSDMRHSPLALALSECSLSEVILGKHGLKGPSTYRRNQTRTPIDGIWVSPRISMLAGGYLDYDQIFPDADHKCLWMDVSFVNAFGHAMPAIIREI